MSNNHFQPNYSNLRFSGEMQCDKLLFAILLVLCHTKQTPRDAHIHSSHTQYRRKKLMCKLNGNMIVIISNKLFIYIYFLFFPFFFCASHLILSRCFYFFIHIMLITNKSMFLIFINTTFCCLCCCFQSND